jgi:macrodomain Ter protein organizer (MatP/YcbG family)
MFVKKLAVVSAVVLLSACSSFGDKRVEKADSVTAEFMGGEIKITYNKDGQFESMTASGSARMTNTLPSGQEEAFLIAKLRAQQKVVEFIKNELESERFKKTVFDSLQEGQTIGGQSNNEMNSKIVSNVQEDIRTKQKGILKGVYIDSKSFDKETKTVLVVVKTSVRDIATANQVRALMGN